ncbi:outer dense fiber protein 2-like isoform X1 [Leucoraja erinacea]|uniref:outer dense fiber protein 2-like isoform X1 n=1 Tax=Leucoraja erinaceus TaxID=7782 RepID=UPI0024554774|nr:outer dense fiber protein 2-like isoform X1 [Leucoraja erinacea]XP_055522319.1 outer dense fiber protein 2-like isoform X1 [Leucoraja erinacea]
MKSRSSLPAVKIYLSEATPVCVYIQKPKLLPSIVERPDRPLETTFDKIENEQMNQSGHQVDRVMKDLKQLKNKLNTSGEQLAEDLIDSAKSKCPDEDLEAKQSWELSRTIYRHGDIWESFGKLQKEQNLNRKENESLTEENKLVVALKEAETASIAAENQVATLKNSIVELIQPRMDCTNTQMEGLTQKLTRSESKTIHLKDKLIEAERNAKEALEVRQKEKDNSLFAKQLSKSVEETRARLQSQLRNKEAESDRLLAQTLRSERTIIGQQLQIECLQTRLSTAKEKAKEDKIVLKKATRTQKRRAERFEATVESLHSQMKDKELKLFEAHRTVDTWSKQYSAAVDSKAQLETKIISLSRRVDAVKEQLTKGTERAKLTSHNLLDKMHATSLETASLQMENAQLKASLTALEERAVITATELMQLQAKAKQLEEAVVQYETQASADELKADLEKAAVVSRRIRDMGDTEKASLTALEERAVITATELMQLQAKAKAKQLEEAVVQYETRASADELKADLEKAAVESMWIRDMGDTEKSSYQSYSGKSSSETLDSLREEKHTLQKALDVLSWKLKEVDIQNQELTETIVKREEEVSLSNGQLQTRSMESAALSRQLEAALQDVSKKVAEVKEQALARERAFQNRILGLESELNRKTKDLKQIQQNKEWSDGIHKTRLQELKLSLEQSENQNRSIQNYIEFLKTSYTAMFGESAAAEFHTEPMLRFDNVSTNVLGWTQCLQPTESTPTNDHPHTSSILLHTWENFTEAN